MYEYNWKYLGNILQRKLNHQKGDLGVSEIEYTTQTAIWTENDSSVDEMGPIFRQAHMCHGQSWITVYTRLYLVGGLEHVFSIQLGMS